MEIKQLSIKGFRGIQEMEIEFANRVNLFVGANGAGKSSITDAVAILLSWFPARIRNISGSGRRITDLDVNNEFHQAIVGIKVEIENEPVSWKLVKTKKGRYGGGAKSDLSELARSAEKYRHCLQEDENACSLPLLVYYPINRAVLDIPLRIQSKHDFGILETYDESLTSGSNFRAFFEWFRNREDLENENRRYQNSLFEPEGGQFPDPQLEGVRLAFKQLLPEFDQVAIRRKPLRMTIAKNGRELRVDQLSDGEKCLMAMVGDLARRLAIANPNAENALEGKGIVIIDEIDLHLHPAWQRKVISDLPKTFPNCQFLISTHSPQIVSHIAPENIFLLYQTREGIKYEKANESYGKNTDRILEDLMKVDARPAKIKKEISEIFELIEQGEIDRSKDTIASLNQQIGDDPELTRARVLIRRKEIIGK